MMKHTTASVLALAILAASILSCVSCGDTGTQTPAEIGTNGSEAEAETETTASAPAETVEAYRYPELDLGGRDFTILDTHQDYGFYSALDVESMTGDGLNDAIYMRNRDLEQQFNFHLVINERYILDAAPKALRKSVLAQDNAYDAAVLRDIYMAQVITEGCLLDMSDCPSLHFDKPWWDTKATEQARLGKLRKLLYAFTDISLADFDGTICCFFNERLLTNLDIPIPYQYVLDGTWTLDRLNEIITAGANLNGDSDFKWDASGHAIYGLASYEHCADALIIGSDLDFYTVGNDNDLVLSTDGEKFFTRAMKIIDILSVSGHYVHVNSDGNNHYEMALKNGRTLMTVAQLKAASKYRDMEDAYGIVPIPKYDEAQETYRNLRTFVYVMCIPVTCPNVEEVGTVMDAMAYLSYRDVMPNFYDTHLSMKLLRDEESVAMLDIIRQTRCLDIGAPFGVSDLIRNVFRDAIGSGSTDIASSVEAVRASVESKIETAMDALNTQ